MIDLVELLEPQPSALWTLIRQIGVTDVVCVLEGGEQQSRWLSSQGSQAVKPPGLHPKVEGEPPWSKRSLATVQQRYADYGLRLVGIEDTPPLDLVRLALPGRDEQLDDLLTQIRAMGELGITVLCYNWSAITSWARTNVNVPLRGGALGTGFNADDMATATSLNPHGEYNHAQLWEGFEYFVRNVMPVAEEAGVDLALHPDDPPTKAVRDVPRIMNSIEAFRRVLAMNSSPSNGVTLCQGNFALFVDNLPDTIREFGRQNRIKFVHFRDVRGTPDSFSETFHDDGPTDMAACIDAYREVGFEGPMRPDHVATLFGEENRRPGYETLGRLFAIGYIRGLCDASYGGADAR